MGRKRVLAEPISVPESRRSGPDPMQTPERSTSALRAWSSPIRQAEYLEWWPPDERMGKLRRSSYRTTDVTAHAAHPDAKRIEGSRELRMVPETDAELGANSTSAWRQRT